MGAWFWINWGGGEWSCVREMLAVEMWAFLSRFSCPTPTVLLLAPILLGQGEVTHSELLDTKRVKLMMFCVVLTFKAQHELRRKHWSLDVVGLYLVSERRGHQYQWMRERRLQLLPVKTCLKETLMLLPQVGGHLELLAFPFPAYVLIKIGCAGLLLFWLLWPDFCPREISEQACSGFGMSVNGLFQFDTILVQIIPS